MSSALSRLRLFITLSALVSCLALLQPAAHAQSTAQSTSASHNPVALSSRQPAPSEKTLSPPADKPGLAVQIWWLLSGFGITGLGVLAFHPRCDHLGMLRLQGLMLLRQSPTWIPDQRLAATQSSPEAEFEQHYRRFATQYRQLGLKLSYSGDGMRLEFGTTRAIPVLRPGGLTRFQQELQSLVDTLPRGKYFLQIHIEGRITGLRAIQNFSLASHGEKVGLQHDVTPRFSLKGVFFNG